MEQADFRRLAFSFFERPVRVGPVEWCERELTIGNYSPDPGPFSLRLRPYAREILESFADNTARDVVLATAAQVAKSSIVSAGLLYRVANRPAPALVVYPSESTAQSYSETRLTPLFETSRQLRALKKPDPDSFRKLEWHLTTCTVSLVGSNSPAALASRSIQTLILDEVDKYADASEKEASAVNLAVERTAAYGAAGKRIYCSTPTVETLPNKPTIWELFQRGDQRYYHVPCPHCGARAPLEMEQVQWDQEAKDPKTEEWDLARVKASAHYVCKACSGRITDGQKTAMLRAGEWIPSNPKPVPGWRSYHLNRLYSPNSTFGDLAIAWLQAKHGSLSDLQNWLNSSLGRPSGLAPVKITDKNLEALLGHQPRGAYDPGDGGTNLLTVDVQKLHWVWLVRHHYRGQRSHLVDWGDALSYEQLDNIFAQYNCHACLIDSSEGRRATEVYEQVLLRPGKWIAAKGQPGSMQEFYRYAEVDPYSGKSGANRVTIPLLHVNDAHWSNELLARLDGSAGGGGWKLTKEMPDLIYQRHITGVKRIERKNKRTGKTTIELKASPPIDLFDCEKLQLCLAQFCDLTVPPAPPPPPEGSQPGPAVEIEEEVGEMLI